MSFLFCNYDKERYIAENAFAFSIFDNFPVNKGHALIISKRHFQNFFETTGEEIKEIYKLLHEVKRIIEEKYKPDGYNVGINVVEYGG